MDEQINNDYSGHNQYIAGIENNVNSLQYFDDLLNCNIQDLSTKAGKDWKKNFDVDTAMDFFISNNNIRSLLPCRNILEKF